MTIGDKLFLGHTIKGRGLAEVDEALDLLSRAPATARFISRKLAVYFVSDNPLAAAGRQDGRDLPADRRRHRGRAQDHVRARPSSRPRSGRSSRIRCITSSRPSGSPMTTRWCSTPRRSWAGSAAWREPLYGHETPDGYPLTEAAWAGPGQMATRFEIARAIGSGSAGLFKPEGAAGGRPAGVSAARQRALLHQPASDARRLHPPGARSGGLAAGLEHAVSRLARIHAPVEFMRR